MKHMFEVSAAIVGVIALTAIVSMLFASHSENERRNAIRQEMYDEKIRFEAYTRGFRDGMLATVKHEMPEKTSIDVAPILMEMKPEGIK